MRIPRRSVGFTLIELLIVIVIIGVLASFVLGAVIIVKKNAAKSMTKADIANFYSQARAYFADTGKWPGTKVRDEVNAFPELFEALFGEKPPRGKGGPNAPYMEIKEERVMVEDDEPGTFRKAFPDEIYDPDIPKYWRDGFGMPLIYHENKSRPYQDYMHNRRGGDIYSTGPDREDQTLYGPVNEGDEIDDIGSW